MAFQTRPRVRFCVLHFWLYACTTHFAVALADPVVSPLHSQASNQSFVLSWSHSFTRIHSDLPCRCFSARAGTTFQSFDTHGLLVNNFKTIPNTTRVAICFGNGADGSSNPADCVVSTLGVPYQANNLHDCNLLMTQSTNWRWALQQSPRSHVDMINSATIHGHWCATHFTGRLGAMIRADEIHVSR